MNAKDTLDNRPVSFVACVNSRCRSRKHERIRPRSVQALKSRSKDTVTTAGQGALQVIRATLLVHFVIAQDSDKDNKNP